MKKIFKVVIGCLLVLVGVFFVAVSLPSLLRAQWLWLPVALVACVVAWAGWRFARGESAKDVVETGMWWTG